MHYIPTDIAVALTADLHADAGFWTAADSFGMLQQGLQLMLQSIHMFSCVPLLLCPAVGAEMCWTCRVPLKNVELETNGNWSSLRRDVSNSWNANGGTYHCPLHIRLTSVLGDVVEDWIPSNQGGQGTAQFAEALPDPAGAAAGALPLTPDYPGGQACCLSLCVSVPLPCLPVRKTHNLYP